ncbi:MAG: energy transducer TonB [Pseudomonadota bacterium]
MRILLLLAVAVTLVACASGNRPLKVVSSVGPVYPPDAKAEGIEGHVLVRYDVGVEGRVRNVRVVEASPPGVFDESARQAVSRWRFQPPTEAGEPQPVEGLESRLEFTRSGGAAYEEY